MALCTIERKPIHIGPLRIPFLSCDSIKPLNSGDVLTIGEQKITVMKREPGRQVPTKVRVDDQEISLAKRKSRFPRQGNQFIALTNVGF